MTSKLLPQKPEQKRKEKHVQNMITSMWKYGMNMVNFNNNVGKRMARTVFMKATCSVRIMMKCILNVRT